MTHRAEDATPPGSAAPGLREGLFTRRGSLFVVLPAGATVIGLLEAAQVYFSSMAAGGSIGWTQAMAGTMPSWYLLAVLAAAVVWIARRYPIERGRLGRSLAVHIPASAVFATTHIVASAIISEGLLNPTDAPISEAILRAFFFYFVVDLAFYWALLGAYYAFDYHRKYREREHAAAELELKASRLEAGLAAAHLQALKMQLHPHFLFNTLNAISALVHCNPDAADRMIARLGELLRRSLEDDDAQEVPLERELDFLATYLDIEETRLGDRLTVVMEVEPEALEAQVPHLILQPLVENSIRHGVAPRATPGRIEIAARREGERLRVEVRDNGPGLPAGGPAAGRGVGLSNTRARLQQLYGSAQEFELTNAEGGGLVARLSIPYHREPAPERPAESNGGPPR